MMNRTVVMLFHIIHSVYSWNALVHKNFEIERACVELEGELESLKEQGRQRYALAALFVLNLEWIDFFSFLQGTKSGPRYSIAIILLVCS